MSDEEAKSRDLIRGLVRDALLQQTGTSAATPPPSEEVVDESTRDVLTEIDIRDLPPNASLLIREDAILTPAARDLLQERSIRLTYRVSRKEGSRPRTIAIGADHGGFEMKTRLIAFLTRAGYAVRDFGTTSTEAVDYPDFAHAVARSVADGGCDLGILVDAAGIGSCMAANKVPGVRAAMCYDEATARNSREHNYANVLSLGGKLISEQMVYKIVQAWLATPEGEQRHGRRVAKIMAIERQYLR